MKNHLFIGLGGEGGKSVAELQKVIQHRHADAGALRDRGQQWDFLYIDSSRDVLEERETWMERGRDHRLDSGSFIHLGFDGDAGPAGLRTQGPDGAGWMGDLEKLGRGLELARERRDTGRRRRVGRFLFTRHAERLRTAVCEAKIAPMLESGRSCAIHIFASLAGGTGSGGIVDLVTMLRAEYPDADVEDGFPIFLYLYVTDGDFERLPVGYFHENQCTALRDLNALCCGKLAATPPGGGELPGPDSSGGEVVTQILLSSHLSGRHELLSLAQQRRMMAEAAFERIQCQVSGFLDRAERSAVLGIAAPAEPMAEPMEAPLRSFRFGSVGVGRWEIPVAEIQDLLAVDLRVSCYRRLLFQNWHDAEGYLGEKRLSGVSGYAECLSEVRAIIDAERVSTTDLGSLTDELGAGFAALEQDQKAAKFKGFDLDAYDAALRRKYASELRGQGVDDAFADLAASREERLEKVEKRIRAFLGRAWTRREQALGLAYIHHLLSELVAELQTASSGETADAAATRERVDKRLSRWRKMKRLSRVVMRRSLAAAHREDLAVLFRRDLRARTAEEDGAWTAQVAARLERLAAETREVAEAWRWHCHEAETRRDWLFHELVESDAVGAFGSVGRTVYRAEVSTTCLQAHLQDQRLEAARIAEVCDELIEGLGVAQDGAGPEEVCEFGRPAVARGGRLGPVAEATSLRWAEGIHDEIRKRSGRASLTTGQILDLFEKRHEEDASKFTGELQAFLDLSTSSVVLAASELQPDALHEDPLMPSMPCTGVVVGIPSRHGFGPRVAAMIKSLLEDRGGSLRAVYHHQDPAQIRMLSVTTRMAARFAICTHRLEEKYREAVAADRSGDVRYFSNIDPAGEAGQRPSLLLPQMNEQLQLALLSMWFTGALRDAPRVADRGRRDARSRRRAGRGLSVVEDEGSAGAEEVVRLGSDGAGTASVATARLPVAAAEAATRLQAETSSETRPSAEPDIDALMTPELSEADVERRWYELKGPIPIGWFVLIGGAVATAVAVALWNPQGATSEADRVVRAALDRQDAAEIQRSEAKELVGSVESRLTAYLAASSVPERLAHVRHPERVAPMMKTWYQTHDFESADFLELAEFTPLNVGGRNFWKTQAEVRDPEGERKIIDGFLLEELPDGEVLVDWETAVDYQPQCWQEYTETLPVGSSGPFRVILEPHSVGPYSHEFGDESTWRAFRVTVFGEEGFVFGYLRRGSRMEARIHRLHIIDGGGPVRAMVRLYRAPDASSPRGVEISELVSPSWILLDD